MSIKRYSLYLLISLFMVAGQPLQAWSWNVGFTTINRTIRSISSRLQTAITKNPGKTALIGASGIAAYGLATGLWKMYKQNKSLHNSLQKTELQHTTLQKKLDEQKHINTEQAAMACEDRLSAVYEEKQKQRSLLQNAEHLNMALEDVCAHTQQQSAYITDSLNIIRSKKHNPFYLQGNTVLYQESPKKYTIELANKGYKIEYSNTEKSTEEQSNNTIEHPYVETLCTVSHPQPENSQPIHFITVHGTWSTAKDFGKSPESMLTPAYHVFAQQLAHSTGRPVIMQTLHWSGKLDQAQRTGIVAQTLAQHLKTVKEQYPDTIFWIYAHSHGCNVTHNAAQKLKDHEYYAQGRRVTIDNAIFLASPAFDIDPATTPGQNLNITSTTMIWGDLDLTGTVGSYQSQGVTTLRKDHALHEKEYVRNIRLKLKGFDLNHINIKEVSIRFMSALFAYIGKHFPIHYELIAHIDTKNSSTRHEECKEESHDNDKYYITGAVSRNDRGLRLQQQAAQTFRLFTTHIKNLWKQALEISLTSNEQFQETVKNNNKSSWGWRSSSTPNLWDKPSYSVFDELSTKLLGAHLHIKELYNLNEDEAKKAVKEEIEALDKHTTNLETDSKNTEAINNMKKATHEMLEKSQSTPSPSSKETRSSWLEWLNSFISTSETPDLKQAPEQNETVEEKDDK